MKRAAILGATILLLAGTAFAQKGKDKGKDDDAPKPKYTRNQNVKVDVKLDERTRPLVAKEDKKAEAPTLSADDVLEVEGAVGDIREDQIQLIQELIDETPDSEVDEKADLYFR